MALQIMNGILSLGLRSIVILISVVDIVDCVVRNEELVVMDSFLSSPVRKGAARSGPTMFPTPHMNCANCRNAGFLCCHNSMIQILLALSHAPPPT
jgi:hypothetical protein